MARNGVFSGRQKPEIVEGSNPLPANSQELHVLAVDDSVVDRKFIERLLKIFFCKVTAVDSGRRALQFLGLDEEKNSVDFDALNVNMIITDYRMPGMTGYELLKKIKESTTFKEIPVVIMSSENILTRIDRCLEEGAEEYILKPVKLSDVKRLKDYVRREDDGEGREEDEQIHERNLEEACNISSSSPSSTSSPSSPSLIESPLSRLRSTDTD